MGISAAGISSGVTARITRHLATTRCLRLPLIADDASPICTRASPRRASRKVLLEVAGLRCVTAMFVERGSATRRERHEHAFPISCPLLKGVHELSTDSDTTKGFEHEQFHRPKPLRRPRRTWHGSIRRRSRPVASRARRPTGRMTGQAISRPAPSRVVQSSVESVWEKHEPARTEHSCPMRPRIESSPLTPECALACAPRQAPDWISS